MRRHPYIIKASDLRHGNQMLYKTDEGWEITTLDWQHIKWCDEANDDFNTYHKPIKLTEPVMSKIRKVYKDNGDSCIEFHFTPPGERQNTNNWWSHEVCDFRILHLSPSYRFKKVDDKWVQEVEPEFWHIWICAHGTGSNWFLSLKDIDKDPLEYFHQLQNLYHVLTRYELILKKMP